MFLVSILLAPEGHLTGQTLEPLFSKTDLDPFGLCEKCFGLGLYVGGRALASHCTPRCQEATIDANIQPLNYIIFGSGMYIISWLRSHWITRVRSFGSAASHYFGSLHPLIALQGVWCVLVRP